MSGVSGTGDVAEGVVFHDGQTVLSWFGQHHTLEVLPNVGEVESIHGHNGKSMVVYDGEELAVSVLQDLMNQAIKKLGLG